MNYYTNLSTMSIDLKILENNDINIDGIYLGQFIKKFKNYYLFTYDSHFINLDFNYIPIKYILALYSYKDIKTFKYKEIRTFLKKNLKNIPYPNEINIIRNFFDKNYNLYFYYNIFNIEHFYYINVDTLKHGLKIIFINRLYFK